MRKNTRFLLLLTALVGMSSCALAVDDGGDDIEVSEYVMLDPVLENVGPTEIQLGQSLRVRGQNFIPSTEGQLILKMSGKFSDSKGGSHNSETEILLNVENAGQASAELDSVIFHPDRNDIGTFQGTVTVVNRRSIGGGEIEEKTSKGESASITVLPSVNIARLRSVDSSIACTEVTNATVKDQQIELGVQALGVPAPSAENPWIVKVGFFAPQMKVYYISPDLLEDDVRFWPLTWLEIEGRDSNKIKKIEEGSHKFEFTVTSLEEGGIIKIDPSRIRHKVRVNPSVEIGNQPFDEVLLGEFRTGDVEVGGSSVANIAVEIVVPNAPQMSRNISYEYFDDYEIPKQYETYLVQRYSPELRDNCIPCQVSGRECEFTYEDSDTTTRERSRGVNWDDSTAQDLGSTYGHFTYFSLTASNNWSSTFGSSYNDSYSVSKQEGRRVSTPVIPGYYAQNYRQMVELEKRVDIIFHNPCGVSGVVGQATLKDYYTSFEIATGPSCQPAPDTRFPAGQVYNPPIPHGSQ